MLVQSRWLLSLFFIASATTYGYPNSPLSPTGPTNGTTMSTSSLPPTTSPATSEPIPPTESFYLVVAKTGTTYDGEYLSVGSSTTGNGLLVLYPAGTPNQATGFSTFNLNADGTLQSDFDGGIAAIFSGGTSTTYDTLFFQHDAAEITESICEGTVGGALTCQTGADTIFYICPPQMIAGTLVGNVVNVGATTRQGCTPLNLLAVPV